jgi:hypothetical protein
MANGEQDLNSGPDFVTVNDLPIELRCEITKKFHDYATLLILNDDYAGSGVLVQMDGYFGILTAEHVVFNPGNPLDNSARSRQILSVPVGIHSVSDLGDVRIQPDVRRVNVNSLRWFPEEPHSKTYEDAEWGPDLAFIRIPPASEFQESLLARISFWNLTLDTEYRMRSALNEGFVAYVGAPGIWIDDDPTVRPGQKVKRIKSAAFLGGAKYELKENGHDFLTTIGNREQGSLLPPNFKGVSGGAVWKFWPRLGDAKLGERKYEIDQYVLAGIAFWADCSDANAPWIRAHGPRSIYGGFLNEVRAWLQGGTT